MEVHDHLTTLDASKTGWILKVRVTRIWETQWSDGRVVHHNMILLDCLNNHIHAIVSPELWQQHGNVVFEGGLYQIINVRVIEARGNYRPVTNTKMLILLPVTDINLYEHDDLMIPFHKFEFRNLPDLADLVCRDGSQEDRTYSIDVIGALEDLQDPQTIQTKYGPKQIVKFRINDGRVAHNVYHVGPVTTEILRLYAIHLEMPKIIILASYKVCGYGGMFHISNLPYSRIYINLDAPEVSSFRNRF